MGNRIHIMLLNFQEHQSILIKLGKVEPINVRYHP